VVRIVVRMMAVAVIVRLNTFVVVVVPVVVAVIVIVPVAVIMAMIVVMIVVMIVMIVAAGARAAGSACFRQRQPQLRRRHAGAQHPLRRQRTRLDREAPERLAQGLDRQPRIEQGAEDHVP
jgi:hypothetical protein